MENSDMSSKSADQGQRECVCPFCEVAGTDEKYPFCAPCEPASSACPECKQPVSRSAEKCPSCGAELEAKK